MPLSRPKASASPSVKLPLLPQCVWTINWNDIKCIDVFIHYVLCIHLYYRFFLATNIDKMLVLCFHCSKYETDINTFPRVSILTLHMPYITNKVTIMMMKFK